MEIFSLNLAGIITATFVGMMLGGLWYSPLLFQKQWMESIGKTAEDIGKSSLPMVGSIVASLLTAVGITIVFSLVGVEGLEHAIKLGLTLSLLVVFPALLSDNLFCGWGLRLLLIQSGYRVLSILLMSITVAYFSAQNGLL